MYLGSRNGGVVPPASGGLTGSILSGVEALGWGLDLPANLIARPLLSGRIDRLGLGITPGEMLDEWGVRPREETLGGWARPLTEFGAAVATDPLSYVSFGGLSNAGKLAKNAGRLDDVARIAGRQLIDDTLTGVADAADFARLPAYARDSLRTYRNANVVKGLQNAPNTLGNLPKRALGISPLPTLQDAAAFRSSVANVSDNMLMSRPLVGSRVSGRTVTLQDLVDDIGTTVDANGRVIDPFRDALKRGQNLDDLLGQTIRHDISIGFPGLGQVGMNLDNIGLGFLGSWKAQSLDRAGQMLRWSRPGRAAVAAFSAANRGQTSDVGQMFAQNLTRAEKNADTAAKGHFADLMQRMTPDDFANPNVRRALETGDPILINTLPQHVQDFVQEWRRPGGLREQAAAGRAFHGLSNATLEDEYVDYFPRYVAPGTFTDEYTRQAARSTDLSLPDQLARQDQMRDLAGGTDVINRLSLDPQLVGPITGPGRLQSDRAAAQYIQSLPYVTGRVATDEDEAIRLARTLGAIDPNMSRNGTALFNNSWAADLETYLRGNQKATAMADEITDFAARASDGENFAAGVGRTSLDEVMQNLGLRTFNDTDGYAPRLQEALQGIGARNADDITQHSLPTAVANNMGKLMEVSKQPHVLNEFFTKYFDPLVNMWKGSILAWPARFTRDWFSGAAVNIAEVKNPLQTLKGYGMQRSLMDGDWEGLYRKLVTEGKSTRYSNAANIDDFKRAVRRDLAQSGIIENRRALDLGETVARQAEGDSIVSQYRAGAESLTDPNRTSTVLLNIRSGRNPLADTAFQRNVISPLFNDPGQFARDFTEVGLFDPKNVRNPLMRWSAELGNSTDFLNRGAGWFALVDNGVDPVEAGRRMLAGHVDYGSTTGVEKWIKRVIPFWTYTSRIGAWTAKQLGENPGGVYRQLMIPHGGPDPDDPYTPRQVRDSYGASLGLKDGVRTFINDFDLPGVDTINKLTVQKNAHGTPSIAASGSQSLMNLVNDMNPILKSVLESATGVDTLTGRPWKERKTSLQRLAEPVVGEDAAVALKRIDPLLQLIPFVSRAQQFASRAVDSERVPDLLNTESVTDLARSRIPQLLFNLFTGVKITPVDQAEINRDQMRIINELLQDDPMIRDFSSPYIPKHLKESGQVDPATELLLQLYQQLSQERRSLQEQRAAAR